MDIYLDRYRGIAMSNRRIEPVIGGFVLLLFLSLILWNIAVSYNFSIQIIIALFTAIYGFYFLGIILKTDDQ